MLDDLAKNIQTYYHSFVALLPKLGLAIIVFTVLLLAARFIRNFSQNRLNSKMDDGLLARFIANFIGMVIILFALLLALRIVGLGGIAVGLLSTAGVGAFVLGFAFKDIGENFLAGIVLAFNRPFRIGDTVELNGQTGKVVALNLRDTQIKTSDGKDIFIPNSNVVKNAVVNYTTDGYLREEFTFVLDYSPDLEKVVGIMQKVLDESEAVIHDEGRMPDVNYGEMGASTLNVKSKYWIDTFRTNLPPAKLKMQLINQTLEALNAAGFYLPSDILKVKTPDDIDNPQK